LASDALKIEKASTKPKTYNLATWQPGQSIEPPFHQSINYSIEVKETTQENGGKTRLPPVRD